MSIQNLYPNLKPSLLLDFANIKQLDSRVTFTRASTATYYDGVTTAKAEENLLTTSNSLASSTGATVALNAATAPDGTTTALTMTEDSSTGQHVAQSASVTFQNLTHTISFFAKPNGRSWIALRYAGINRAWFDVTNGVVGTVDGSATASISASAQGFYRCVVTFTPSAGVGNLFFRLGSADNTDSYAGNGTSGAIVWGVQVEQRSSATAYTPTTTQPITNYIPVLQTAAAGVARFDHNPTTGESLGLLIEEQRTNLLTYSEQFDNAAWTKESCTIAANAATAPDGTITADKLVSASATAATRVSRGSIGYNGTHTFSIYAKADGARYAQVIWSGGLSAEFANFDLQTGAVVGGTAGMGAITAVGNGWYRCSITTNLAASPATGTPFFGVIDVPSAARGATYTGNGYSGIYIWGAQLEAGAFPTSYIKTTSAQVTRSADAASMTGANFSSWYRADEGTFYAGVSVFDAETPTSQVFIEARSDANNYLAMYVQVGDGFLANNCFVNGVVQAQLGLIDFPNTPVSFANAFAYKVNDFAGVYNGAPAVTDTSGVVPAPTALFIGNRGDFARPLNGHIRRIAYYPKRLTNTELQGLTS